MFVGALSSSREQTIEYLRTLPSIRERCGRVHDLAKQGKLKYFGYHPDREEQVADYCIRIIKRDFGDDFSIIPPHGRWRHLDAGVSRIAPLVARWDTLEPPPDRKEKTKRLIDLFLVSVLLDAGAGNDWIYRDEASGKSFSRSEGLGVASFNMFMEGFFSGDDYQPHRVDAKGLELITTQETARAMQVSSDNPMVGLEGRASLLVNLSHALKNNPTFFGAEGRPGNMLDYLESESTTDGPNRRVPLAALWHVLVSGLTPIWPTDRTTLGGVPLGDVWPCDALKAVALAEGDELVPFHKLTGWTTYSLIEPIEKILEWRFDGLEDMTGLPEYRNGGLLVDLGVLSLKPEAITKAYYPSASSPIPRLPPSHPAIVEWRAMTVIELDRIADLIRAKLNLSREKLTLAQVLESATWKGGREIAKDKRPESGGPPIEIVSDGTVF
ncbi:DUF1688-domain-containing protein [Multifurca ochricompacta]|uniref:DUF1688-domain-containing protein n=1 Tax=Multifurca ochricompacta TaxID=376703 RepID=A0AAD4M2U0_9AGAM|nr:DUF1688-domain-containing protein [Multifurca ochricompacta]